jgi:hypothetical protein
MTREDIEHAESVFGKDELPELIHSVGGMGCIMGFLNRFNDLVGVEIEASIKQTIDNSALADDWDWGTHATEDHSNRHDYRDQQPAQEGLPSKEQFKQLVDLVQSNVFNELEPLHAKYSSFDKQLLPDWIDTYPEPQAIQAVSALYHAAFNTGSLESETKHLAAYVLALGSNHPHMAMEERRITELVTQDSEKLKQKIKELEEYAQTGKLPADTILSGKEITSMKLARISQSFPHEVRGAMVMELNEALSPEQIVELVVSLSVVGMGQRWTNINCAFGAENST